MTYICLMSLTSFPVNNRDLSTQLIIKGIFCSGINILQLKFPIPLKVMFLDYIVCPKLMLSESHCHSHCRQPQPPVPNHLQLPDPSHLSFDHLHLRSLISTPINSTHSLTLIVRSMVHDPERYLTATHLPVFTYLLDLPEISCDYPWTPGSPSDSPANSPAHPSVRTPFPCGQEQFSVRARTTRILIVKILTFSPLSLFPVISPINISLCYLPVASGYLCDKCTL